MINKDSYKRTLLVTAISLALGGTPAITLAQSGLEEIIVTARKKQESLQDVPVAVMAVSGETIANWSFDQIDEVAVRIPNLQVQTGGAGQGGGIWFRGIGSNFNAGAFESSLAINVDGAVVSTARILQNNFFDLETFELLKGPQALYFGKAATAGVLSLRTRNPGDDFELMGSVAYETEQESTIGEVIVSGPITDTLGARLAGRFKDTDEVWENIAAGVENSERGEESRDIRLTLVWVPTEDLDFNLKYSDHHYENDGAFQGPQILFQSTLPGADGPDFTGPTGYVLGVDDGEIGVPDPVPIASTPSSRYLNGGVPYSENDTSFLTLRGTFDFHENYRLVGLFSWTDIKDTGMDNYAGTYVGNGTSGSRNEFDFKTYELRLEADLFENVSFMAGGFYEDSNQFFEAEQFNAFAFVGIQALGVQATTPDFEGATYDLRKTHDTDTEIYSYFASADWEISDRITLTGGVRYTDVEREGTIKVPYVHDFLIDLDSNDLYAEVFAAALTGSPAFAPVIQTLFGGAADTRNGTYVTPVIDYEDDDTNIEAVLDYEFVDGQRVYVAYKEAYKPGGIDNSVTAWNDDIPSITSAGEGVVFEGEEVDGFELGYKGQMLDDRLRINGVFYNFEYSDFQIQAFRATSLSFITTNAGEVTSQGLELEFDYLPNIDGLALYGAFAWDNSEFDDYTDPVTGHVLDGRELGQLPEYSGNIGFNYQNNFGKGGWRYDVGYNLRYSDDYYLDNQNSGNCGGCATEAITGLQQDSFTTHDLRFGLTSPSGRWSVSLIGNNITDEYYAVASAGVAPGALDDQQIIRNEGRTITFKLGAVF